MCNYLIKIRNPKFNQSSFCSQNGDLVIIPEHLKDNRPYIDVPCGKCAECRSVYFNSILQRALIESKTSYLYFVTLTYDNKHIPFIDLPEKRFYYADYSHIQDMIKRLRNLNIIDREFRYLCVNEYGDDKHRPHFHLIFFISKLDTDIKTTPFIYEKILFENLCKFFAVNVGTRKSPKYEPLFSYRVRYTRSGIQSNYFVKYVLPTDEDTLLLSDFDNDNYVKTIRYLLGYVNKGSSFDNYISSIIDSTTDLFLKKKLSAILRCRVRYSKGFGFGFLNGEKNTLSKSFIKSSYSSFYYTDVISSLPDTFLEYIELYGNFDRFNSFIESNIYSNYKSLRECIDSMNIAQFTFHCVVLKYFPNYFNTIYERYYKVTLLPVISYFYSFLHRNYKYNKPKFSTSIPDSDNPLYSFFRKMIDEGVKNKLSFIPFKVVSEGKYYSLCDFYKQRVISLSDIQNMYDSCGFNSYEDWLNSFKKIVDTTKSAIARGNLLTKENDEIICNSQKSCLNLHSKVDLYHSLFVL